MGSLSFCLFGVYEVGENGRVVVKEPGNCKPGCPACARVCPEAAIMFPKYASAPINGGEAKTGGGGQPVKVDISAMLGGGNAMQTLRDRTARFSLQRSAEEAQAERQRHLQSLDIPPSVLASLPPLAEMRLKAAEAKAKAQKAKEEKK